MLLSDLATAVRKSGLPVVEVPGWRTRGHGEMGGVKTIVCHHTAGPSTGNYPSLGTVRDGRPGLSGPLANLGLGRDGTVYVIAAGLCYHAGEVLRSDYGNGYSIGIEAEATGISSWPDVQMDAYARLCKALCEHYGVPVARVLGHKEVCAPVGRKTDPNFDMAVFRLAVAGTELEADMTPAQEAKLDAVLAKLDKLDKVLDRITKSKREILAAVEDDE